MATFFIPAADSPEQAEKVYGTLAGALPEHIDPRSRLFRVEFLHNQVPYVAEVGRGIESWPEYTGPVLAIFEAERLVYVVSQVRGGLCGGPIFVSPGDVTGRTYFEGFGS